MSNSPRPPEETLAWLRLTLVPGLSCAAQQALLRHYGTPQAIFARSCEELGERLGETLAGLLCKGPGEALLDATVRWLEGAGRHLVTLGEPEYPKALLETKDPPTSLYAHGRLELLNTPSIAIVGSRNATSQGLRDARALAGALSDAGLCIVSGMALGIDAAAHEAGLEGPASTVAVLGTGVDVRYPRRNHGLARRIAAQGCLLSEFPLGTPAVSRNFPRRNRLISGLSRGVLVVEAARHSGSMITARYAGEQGRDVFAVPGSIHSPLSKGCHDLIKQGAILVDDANDIFAEFHMGQPGERAGEAVSGGPPDAILELMGFGPVSVDELAMLSGMAAGALAARMSRLELDGRIAPTAGGRFQRIEPARPRVIE